MDNKKIILIGIIILIVAVGAIAMMLVSVNYERIEITPNGTSIEVPANQTKYRGEIDGVKIWNWDKGVLVTYNSNENSNIVGVTEWGFNAINGLIEHGEKQNIDGFTGYVINADELLEIHVFDIVKVNYNGKFYCIPLSNETTHDNILICCNDRDIAAHMAKSVHYKNVYPTNKNWGNASFNVENVSELLSKVDDYANSTDLNDIKSSIEDNAGDLISKLQ